MYRYIIAMLIGRQEAREYFHNASRQIIKHIIKLLYYPTSQDCKHWKQEIYNFLNDTSKLRGTNKWPSEKFTFQSLADYNDAIEGFVKQIRSEYGEPESYVSISDILSAVETYQHMISKSLSQEGAVFRDEAYAKLDEIVNSYHKD